MWRKKLRREEKRNRRLETDWKTIGEGELELKIKEAKRGKVETERRKYFKNCEKTTGNKVQSEYKKGNCKD